MIQVLNRQRLHKIHRQAVVVFCNAALLSLDLGDKAVSVVFTGKREMRILNRRYRGRNEPTDVLSFSYEDTVIDGMPFMGEIIISPEVAFSRAAGYGYRPERELRRIIVHGLLHLMGYDHETDNGVMNLLQQRLTRRKFFRSDPLLTGAKEKR
ncbi:MAG TPA: rRNA maturation RNase YbeY [Acidobacteriota bacterium]|nr:rRNA maturation RNase YbeY [Acidobacteriota bacterium]